MPFQKFVSNISLLQNKYLVTKKSLIQFVENSSYFYIILIFLSGIVYKNSFMLYFIALFLYHIIIDAGIRNYQDKYYKYQLLCNNFKSSL